MCTTGVPKHVIISLIVYEQNCETTRSVASLKHRPVLYHLMYKEEDIHPLFRVTSLRKSGVDLGNAWMWISEVVTLNGHLGVCVTFHLFQKIIILEI